MTTTARSVDAQRLITIGELSRRTNVAISALRYYEELGLLEPHTRISGKRRYTADAVDTVGLIRFLGDLHFTLREIGSMVKAMSGAQDDWHALARRKVAELDDLIAKATAARVALDHGLRCPHGDVGECPRFWAILERHQAGESLALAHAHGDQDPAPHGPTASSGHRSSS